MALESEGSAYVRYPQLAKEALITSRRKPNPENRFWAKVIDISILLLPLLFLEWIFPSMVLWFSLLYWSLIEGIGRGQSPGKWLLGLHTIEVNKATRPRFYNSLLRNLPFALLLPALIKSSILWLPLAVVTTIWLLMETYFVFVLRSGIRVGDILGFTRVFDYKDIHTQFIEQFLKKEENN